MDFLFEFERPSTHGAVRVIVVGQPSLDAMHVEVMRTFAPCGRAGFSWYATGLTAHVEWLVTNCTLIVTRIPFPHGYCMERFQRDLHDSTQKD